MLIQHDGEATLLIPPETITTTSPSQSETVSILSTNSSRTIQYQRPFRFTSSPSLTDLRSVQTTLRDSLASSGESSASMSTVSSGITGIGYLSGRAVQWVGIQMLDGLVPLEIRRRRRAIRKLVKQIANIPETRRAEWLIVNEKRVNRSLEDLLELSAYVSSCIDSSCRLIGIYNPEILIIPGIVQRRLTRGYLSKNFLKRVTSCLSTALRKPPNYSP